MRGIAAEDKLEREKPAEDWEGQALEDLFHEKGKGTFERSVDMI